MQPRAPFAVLHHRSPARDLIQVSERKPRHRVREEIGSYAVAIDRAIYRSRYRRCTLRLRPKLCYPAYIRCWGDAGANHLGIAMARNRASYRARGGDGRTNLICPVFPMA